MFPRPIPYLLAQRCHAPALVRVACLAYLSAAGALIVIVAGLSVALSWRPVIVLSGSMAPALDAGDILLLDPSIDRTTVDVGSVVTFEDPATGELVTHRVTATNADGTYQTTGDASRQNDRAALEPKRIRGEGRGVVPVLGLPVVWAHRADWFPLLATAAMTALTVHGAWSRRGRKRGHRRRPARARRHLAVASAPLLALGAVTGPARHLPVSSAVFSATTTNPGNQFQGAATFGGLGSGGSNATTYRGAVVADSPVAHWRLGESSLVLFQDDFETFTGWTDQGTGTFRSSTARAYTGTSSGIKDTANDPSGGWKSLGTTLGNEWVLEAWIYRPSVYTGGGGDRVTLENSSGNGYGFHISHDNNALRIVRVTSTGSTNLWSISYNPPEDTWFRVALVRSGNSLSMTMYGTDGSMQADVWTSDSTYSTFDRVTVRGGYQFYVDDLTVSRPAADEQLLHGGHYTGGPQLGVATLITGDTNNAVRFDGTNDAVFINDHPNINAASGGYAARTVELWFSADNVSRRQVLWEEGGTANGMNVYLDSGTLYGRAWSESNAWTNPLQTTMTVSAATRYHVIAVLDAASGNLRLYVNGALQATSTKADTASLATHNQNGAIGATVFDTEFHDGNSLTTWGHFFGGVIDEVVVYNVALSAAQVLAHYRAGR